VCGNGEKFGEILDSPGMQDKELYQPTIILPIIQTVD